MLLQRLTHARDVAVTEALADQLARLRGRRAQLVGRAPRANRGRGDAAMR
jgi:hypothetical protein